VVLGRKKFHPQLQFSAILAMSGSPVFRNFLSAVEV
jgi:hypothetical protein